MNSYKALPETQSLPMQRGITDECTPRLNSLSVSRRDQMIRLAKKWTKKNNLPKSQALTSAEQFLQNTCGNFDMAYRLMARKLWPCLSLIGTADEADLYMERRAFIAKLFQSSSPQPKEPTTAMQTLISLQQKETTNKKQQQTKALTKVTKKAIQKKHPKESKKRQKSKNPLQTLGF